MTAYSDTALLLCAEAPLLVHTAKHGVTVCNHFHFAAVSTLLLQPLHNIFEYKSSPDQ